MKLKWKLVLVRLEIMPILTQEGAHFALKVPLAQKLFWTHPMKLLGDMGRLESRFGPFGDSVIIGARGTHGWRETFHRLRKSFSTHPMELLGDVGPLESCFRPFGLTVSVGAR
jgi:hypothetical protein